MNEEINPEYIKKLEKIKNTHGKRYNNKEEFEKDFEGETIN